MNKTQNLIFNAAIRIFSQKGFSAATMDEIAEAAGVAKGTLYYNFASKEDIFRFIIDEGIKNIEDEIKDKTRHFDDPIDKLRIAFKVQLELTIEYIEFFRTLFSQIWGTEERHNHVRQVTARYFSFFEGYLTEILGEEVTKNNNLEFIAYNFFGMIVSTVVYGMLEEEQDIRELSEKFVESIMKNIK